MKSTGRPAAVVAGVLARCVRSRRPARLRSPRRGQHVLTAWPRSKQILAADPCNGGYVSGSSTPNVGRVRITRTARFTGFRPAAKRREQRCHTRFVRFAHPPVNRLPRWRTRATSTGKGTSVQDQPAPGCDRPRPRRPPTLSNRWSRATSAGAACFCSNGRHGRGRPGAHAAGAVFHRPAPPPADLTFSGHRTRRHRDDRGPSRLRSDVVISWGDPLFGAVGVFDVNNSAAAAQERRFGFNSDFVLPAAADWAATAYGRACSGSTTSTPTAMMMFPGYDADEPDAGAGRHRAGRARRQRRSRSRATATAAGRTTRARRYNRRITATTPMTITGPAAGDDWLKTTADPTGTDGARHAQQLRRRLDPLGHRPHRARRTSTSTSRTPTAVADAGREGGPRPLRHRPAAPASAAGRRTTTASTSPRSRTSRSASAGSSRSIRTTRPRTPMKRTALGRFKHEAAAGAVAPRRQARGLHRRRRALRLRLQVRHRRHGRPAQPRREHGPARRRARSTSPSSTTTAPAVAAAGLRAGPADGGTASPTRPTC